MDSMDFKKLFQSYYCYDNDKAMPISDLIQIFEKYGNHNVNVSSDENIGLFSATQWKNFNNYEKNQVLQKYRLAYLSDSWVNWCESLGTVLANDEVKEGFQREGAFL